MLAMRFESWYTGYSKKNKATHLENFILEVFIMTKYNMPWTAKTLKNKMEKQEVNFDNAVQRSLVWDTQRKSLLIHSMLYGYAIPPMYFTKENGIYDSLDGKQRSNAIVEFLNGEFPLDLETPIVFDDEGNPENFSGMTFSQLPEWAQDRIKDYSLTIYYYENMTEAEIKEFFRRLNNGKPLSNIELTRVGTPNLKVFQELAEHDAIQTVVTPASKKRFGDENIAMQLYHFVTEKKPDFSTKNFRAWAAKVEPEQEVIDRLIFALDTFFEFYNTTEDKKIIKTIKTRTHFISCIYYFYLCKEYDNLGDKMYTDMEDFFNGNPTQSEIYNNTVSAGSAKQLAVTARKNVIRALARDNAGITGAEEAGADVEEADSEELIPLF